MTDEPLDISPLERAIQRLDEGWARYQLDTSDLQIRDGLIQRFEFTYELSHNGSMSSSQSGEGDIRTAMVKADVVDCMIALPGQLFYSTQIPACLWFLAKNKRNGGLRDRRGEVLFIDARQLGHLVDRTRRELSDEDIDKIAGTYHAWRGEMDCGTYEDVPGFCKAALMHEIAGHGYVMTPGRYVGAAAVVEEDETPFAERFAALQERLDAQFEEAEWLTTVIREKIAEILL